MQRRQLESRGSRVMFWHMMVRSAQVLHGIFRRPLLHQDLEANFFRRWDSWELNQC
jgi:hypothetical protein